MANILASFIIEGNKYVFTRGMGSPDFKTAKEISDFAVYLGNVFESDETIAREGDKVSPSQSVKLFGGMFDVTEKDFRR